MAAHGCGKKGREEDLWPSDGYQRVSIDVEITEGTHYPEGSDVDELSWQFCTDCFKSKVMPLAHETADDDREHEIEWELHEHHHGEVLLREATFDELVANE